MPLQENPSKFIIYLALLGNLMVAAIKFGAAVFTGSASMLGEGIHSLVDTGNEVLLIYGLHRSAAPPDRDHPLGYGRELYFWSFMVALLVFVLGSIASIYEGVHRILNPEPIAHVSANYIVLLASAIIDGSTWWITVRRFKGKRHFTELFRMIRESKDPPSFIVVFEDSASLLGLIVAALGISLSAALNLPVLDGVATILIGLILALTASVLARETKGLLIGERADEQFVQSILALAKSIDGVVSANDVVTTHLAPDQIIAALSIEFADELRTSDIEAKVMELENRLCRIHPNVKALFIKPQSPGRFQLTMGRRGTMDQTESIG